MVSRKCFTAAIIALIVLLGVIIFLALRLNSVREESAYIQSGVDQIYQQNFSGMKENLFCTEPSDESDAELAKCFYVCGSLYSSSSYAENDALREVVNILGSADSSAQLREGLADDMDFLDKLGQLTLKPADKALAQEVLTCLEPYAAIEPAA